MKKKTISTAEHRKEQQASQSIDPVALARNVLLLPRGTAALDLILFFRETMSLPAESENWRFALASYQPGLSAAGFELAQAFRSLGAAQREWVTALVDVEIGKAQGITLSNAGYGGYPLFSEWARAVHSAMQSGAQSITPDESYSLLGLFGQKQYIDLVETMRHYETLFVDTVEALKLASSDNVPPMEEVCFQDRLPLLDPELANSPKAEKKLSVVISGYYSANRVMAKILTPHLTERYSELFDVEKSAGQKSYKEAIIWATALLGIVYNLIETLTKRPRVIPEAPSSELSTPLTLTVLAGDLQRSGVPSEAVQSLLSAYHALEQKVGAGQVAQTVRERTVCLLDDGEVRKLVACRDEDPDKVIAWSNRQKGERRRESLGPRSEDDLQAVQAAEFIRGIGKFIEQTRKKHRSFLIKRHSEELAILTPATDSVTPSAECIVSTKTLAINRSILDSVKEGQTYWLTRREKIVGVLVPPPPTDTAKLSEEEREKLRLSGELTIEQFRIAIQLATGETTLKDVLQDKS